MSASSLQIMNRLLLLSLLFLPSLAAAQVEGVSLVFKHDVSVTQQSPSVGQLSAGHELVAVYPDQTNKRLELFGFDGTRVPAPEVVSVNSVAFAGKHLYVGDADGIEVFDRAGQKVQSLTGERLDEMFLTAAPDGKTIFGMNGHAPGSITIYARDDQTGKLTQTQVFQTDEAGLALARASKRKLIIDKLAIRVPKFDGLSCMATDGKRLFVACSYSNSIVVFAKSSKGWQHLQSVTEYIGREKNGLMMCRSVAFHDGDVFVGGIKRLNRLRIVGEELEPIDWWVDDVDRIVRPDHVLPCLENAHSLAISKNGKYLFIGSTERPGVTVFKIGDILEEMGTLKDSPAGAKALDVAVSPDGTKLFSKTTTCHLLIYDLDSRFTE